MNKKSQLITAYTKWELPDNYRIFIDSIVSHSTLFTDVNRIITVNNELRNNYDENDEFGIWEKDYLAIGSNQCGDYHYLINGCLDKIFYADPDRLGEWGPNQEPIFHNIEEMLIKYSKPVII